MTRLRAAAVATVALVAVAMVGVSLAASLAGKRTPATLRAAGKINPTAELIDNTRPGHKYSTGGVLLCIVGGRRVEITGAEAERSSGGFAITDWAVRPNPWARGKDAYGGARRGLDEAGFGGSNVVDVRCGSRRTGVELGLEFEKSSRGHARGMTVLLHYTSEGDERVARLPLGLGLCAGRSAAGCDIDVHSLG